MPTIIAKIGEDGKRYAPDGPGYHVIESGNAWTTTADGVTAWDRYPYDFPLSDADWRPYQALCGATLPRGKRQACWVAGPTVTCARCAALLTPAPAQGAKPPSKPTRPRAVQLGLF